MTPAARSTLDRARRPLAIVLVAMNLLILGAVAGFVLADATNGQKQPTLTSVDVGFLQDMSVHHEQAVDMATRIRAVTRDPTLRLLAFDIESGQTAQIGRMQGWLELWQAPAQPAGRPYMSWMDGSGGHHGTTSGHDESTTMPGMSSPDELNRLRTAIGRELDVLFLQLMKRHHEGAFPMLKEASRRATRHEVRNLAEQMLRAQSAEVDVMGQLLSARGAA